MPRTFGASTRAAASGVRSWITPPPARPAAWITPWSSPKRATAASTMACICAPSATSAPTTSTSAPSASMLLYLADPQTDAIPLAMHRQPLVPGSALGERRDAEQHQARPVLAGQELGESEAEAAETAGDQVDAPLAQPDALRRRRLQAHGLVVLHPAARRRGTPPPAAPARRSPRRSAARPRAPVAPAAPGDGQRDVDAAQRSPGAPATRLSGPSSIARSGTSALRRRPAARPVEATARWSRWVTPFLASVWAR